MKSPKDETEDNRTSLKYAEMAVGILASAGFDKSYYHRRDARPGRNIFDELFRVINHSNHTLLILTPGFLENCWFFYCGQSAFKTLLDKEEVHRLIALAFNLTGKQIPQVLNHHQVIHFEGHYQRDEENWNKLIKEMIRDTEQPGTFIPISEAGDNRLHTASKALVVHPEGQQSLDMDGAGQNSVQGNTRNITRGEVARGASEITRGTEHLQIDDDYSRTADREMHGSSISRAVPSNQGPQTTSAGDSQPVTQERELMAKQINSEKLAIVDIKDCPQPQPASSTMSMSLTAGPTVSAPKLSLSNDEDLTYDDGIRRSLRTVNETGTEEYRNDYIESTEKSQERQSVNAEIVQARNVNVKLGTNPRTDNNDFESLNFNSLQEETVPKGPFDSGYHTEASSPDKMQQSGQVENLETGLNNGLSSRSLSTDGESALGDSIGARRSSGDMQELKEIPPGREMAEMKPAGRIDVNMHAEKLEKDNKKDASETMVKINNSSVSQERPQHDSTDNTSLKTVYDDSSERPRPEGQDAGVFSSEVCHSNDPASKTSDQLVQVRQELVADFNWKCFSFHCISRAISRTDSLL